MSAIPRDWLARMLDLDRADDWQERALCAQTDPESFFPEQGAKAKDAKATCLRCEVRTECLNYALDNDERHGIWGGLNERERRKYRNGQETAEVPGQVAS